VVKGRSSLKGSSSLKNGSKRGGSAETSTHKTAPTVGKKTTLFNLSFKVEASEEK